MIFFLLNQRKQTSSDVNLNAVLLKWIDRGSSCRDVVVFFLLLVSVFFFVEFDSFCFFILFFFLAFFFGRCPRTWTARGNEKPVLVLLLLVSISYLRLFFIFISFYYFFKNSFPRCLATIFFSPADVSNFAESRTVARSSSIEYLFFFLRYLFCGIFLALIRLSTSVISTRFLDIDVTDDLMKRERCNEMTQN